MLWEALINDYLLTDLHIVNEKLYSILLSRFYKQRFTQINRSSSTRRDLLSPEITSDADRAICFSYSFESLVCVLVDEFDFMRYAFFDVYPFPSVSSTGVKQSILSSPLCHAVYIEWRALSLLSLMFARFIGKFITHKSRSQIIIVDSKIRK